MLDRFLSVLYAVCWWLCMLCLLHCIAVKSFDHKLLCPGRCVLPLCACDYHYSIYIITQWWLWRVECPYNIFISNPMSWVLCDNGHMWNHIDKHAVDLPHTLIRILCTVFTAAIVRIWIYVCVCMYFALRFVESSPAWCLTRDHHCRGWQCMLSHHQPSMRRNRCWYTHTYTYTWMCVWVAAAQHVLFDAHV